MSFLNKKKPLNKKTSKLTKSKSTQKKNNKTPLQKLTPRTRRSRVFAFILIFGLVGGGYMVYKSFAATAAVNCRAPSDLKLNYCVNDSDESKIIRLYYGVLDRAPEREGLDYWVGKLKGTGGQPKWSLQKVAQYFVNSKEFSKNKTSLNALGAQQFIQTVYGQTFDRDIGSPDLNFWVAQLNQGKPREWVAISITESKEAQEKYRLNVATALGFKQQWDNRPAEVRKNYSIVFVAGQSNAVGNESYVQESAAFNDSHPAYSSYWMSFKNHTAGDQLNPVRNLKARQNESSGKQIFGPEIGLARTLYENGKRDVLIVKVAEGATPLDKRDKAGDRDWNVSSVNENYSDLIKQGNAAYKWVADRGATYTVEGLVWMQGESDTDLSASAASNYYANLSNFWSSTKSSLGMNQKAPMIIGKIDLARHWAVRKKQSACRPSGPSTCASEIQFTQQVQQAQQRLADERADVDIIPTSDLPVTGSYQIHFSPYGQMQLGKRFAEKLLQSWQ